MASASQSSTISTDKPAPTDTSKPTMPSNKTLTMLHFQRGTKSDAMTNFAAFKVEIDDKTNAATLRQKLNDMHKSDRFLNVHGFPLPNSTDVESSTLLEDLLVEDSSSKNSGEKSASDVALPKGSTTTDELPIKNEKSGSSPDKTLDAEVRHAPSTAVESNNSGEKSASPSGGGIKVIRILAKEEKKREALKLGDWPKDPGFWSSDIMNDAVLPPKNAPGFVAPEGAGDLSTFLDINSFGIVQWSELIKSNNLLKGVRMGNSGPRPSAFAMFEGPPDLEHFYTFRQPNAYIDIQTVTSEHTSKFISQGWQSGSLSVGTPFVSIAVEGEKREMSGSRNVHKTIFTTAFYKYAFVTIVFDPMTLTPTSKFNQAVAEALGKESDDAKRAALRNLFDRYGHIFQTEVTLGAMLTTTDKITTDDDMTQAKFEDKVKTKLAAAIPSYGIEIGASYGTGTQTDRQTRDTNQEERKTITAKGGNPLLSTALAKWIPSIADYRTWRIIEVGAAVPTTEFIRNPEQKKEVVKLANADPDAYTKPLRGRWVEAVQHMTNSLGDGKSWFCTYRPLLDDGWYWLGQSLDGRYALEVQENGSQGDALSPVRDLTLIHRNYGSKGKDWESFWKIHPINTDHYVFLGDHFQSGNTTGTDNKVDMTSGEYSRLRAVRQDLCVYGTISDKPYWSNETTSDKKWVTVYQPVYQSGSEPVLDHYLFRAFENSPSERDFVACNSHTYMLKQSSIFMENFR